MKSDIVWGRKLNRKENNMTLKQLIYFLKIAETGSLTKAAQLLHISQPPLSYQLKLLEEELDTQLFIRDVRCMHLTEEGEFLRDRATVIVEELEQIPEEIRSMGKNKSVCLNIGSVSSAHYKLLPNIILRIEEIFPDIVVNIYDGTSERVLELLDKGTVEIGIVREPFNSNQYASKKLDIVEEKDNGDYMIACGLVEQFFNHHPDEIKLRDLLKSQLIVHRRFEELIVEKCNQKDLTPHIISRNDSIITSIEWAKFGLGVAIMPLSSSYVINDSSIKVKKIVDPVFYSNLHVVWNKGMELTEPALKVLDMI